MLKIAQFGLKSVPSLLLGFGCFNASSVCSEISRAVETASFFVFTKTMDLEAMCCSGHGKANGDLIGVRL